MGVNGQSLIEIFGLGDELSLDARKRFRLPDALVDELRRAYERISPHTDLPADAVNRLPFYFAPGTNGRIFLYPAPNIKVATARFERPPAGIDPARVRKARDYFYGLLRFAEADRQNRLQLPEALRQHAELGDDVDRIVLTCRGRWLTISKAPSEPEQVAERRAAFEECSEDLLDSVEPGEAAGLDEELL